MKKYKTESRKIFLLLTAILVLTGFVEQRTSTYSLQPPYDISLPAMAHEFNAFKCKPIPAAPLTELVFSNVYKKDDPYLAEIDEDAKQKYTDQTKYLYRTETQLLEMSNLYLATGNPAVAACVLDWLFQWAVADALLGKVNSQGVFVRQWSLASFSSAYLQIKSYAKKEPEKNKIVREWLKDIAVSVQSEYGNISDSRRPLNNHFYWAAWAVTNTGVALNKRNFYDWGIGGAKYALIVQAKDGVFPLEMQRGKKALQYHIFSLGPLIMINETATRNGENLYEAGDGATHSLIANIFAAIKNPSLFEELSGFKQDSVELISSGHYSWMEVYNARFPDEEMNSWLKKHRPVFSRRTGGDMTFLYTRKNKN